jgi:hypothetical protein
MVLFAYRVAIGVCICLLALLTACSDKEEPSSSPTPAASATHAPSPPATPVVTASAAPTATAAPTPEPTPEPAVEAGKDAWVSVSVATLWRDPSVVRAVDEPALENPVRISDWLGQSDLDRADLEERADSQMLLGDRVTVLAIDGDWAQVVVPDQQTPLDYRGYPGWVPVRQLSAIAPTAHDNVATVIVPSVWLTSESGEKVMEVSFGTRLPIFQTYGVPSLELPGGRRLVVPVEAVKVSLPGEAALEPTMQSGTRQSSSSSCRISGQERPAMALTARASYTRCTKRTGSPCRAMPHPSPTRG